jgi:hypothetical protein
MASLSLVGGVEGFSAISLHRNTSEGHQRAPMLEREVVLIIRAGSINCKSAQISLLPSTQMEGFLNLPNFLI